MGASAKKIVSLTPEQRRLVNENLGLIVVHLKRYVTNLATPRRDREWDDLFQEGCIGLIRAAVLFRKERGIPFAAFALPRIHNAVSRALHTKFSNVYVPPRRHRKGSVEPTMSDSKNPNERPREYSLGDDSAAVGLARARNDPALEPGRDTIGDRLRHKYERAVHRARVELSGRASTRGDRDTLLSVLEHERFLVPQEDQRRALRQIARDTKSSYARVAQCDKRMGELIRQYLESDGEFVALRGRARTSPLGTYDIVDDGFDRELADLCADQFAKRFRDADRATRGTMLAGLLEMSDDELVRVARDRFRVAKPIDRTRIMEQSPG